MSEQPPVLVAGAQGPKGKRPHEKKIEAKNISKVFGEALVVEKRVTQPRGMVWGGGSSDYVMRKLDSPYKPIVWAAEDTRTGLNSLCRYLMYYYGPLASLTTTDEEKDQKIGIGPRGIPINIQAIQRARGAYTYVQKAKIAYRKEANSIDGLNISASQFIADTPTGRSLIIQNIPLATAAAAGVVPKTGFCDITATYRFIPADNVEFGGAFTYKDVGFYLTLEAKCSAAAQVVLDDITVSGAVPATLFTCSFYQYLAVGESKTLWLDMFAAMEDVTPGSVTPNIAYIRLSSASGTTLGGHDGLPYDYQV